MFNDLNRKIADRFQVTGRFLTEIGNEKDVADLLDSIIRRDARAFGKFVDRLTFPPDVDFTPLGKCWWLSELVEEFVSEWRPRQYKAIRLALSEKENFLRLQCIFRNPRGGTTTKKDNLGNDREIIENNDELLRCLESEGLVEEITIYENVNSVIFGFGPPQKLCF
jgi:hypothetical protein